MTTSTPSPAGIFRFSTCFVFCLLAALFFSAAVSRLPASTYSWTGPSPINQNFSGNWNVASNWTPFGWPSSATDIALISNASAPPYTVTLNLNLTLNEIFMIAPATLSATSRVLETIGSSTIDSGTVFWNGSTWRGGTLTNKGLMRFEGGSVLDFTTFSQEGDLVIQGRSTADGFLTVRNGFANLGSIELTSIANRPSVFRVTNGVLENFGTIALRPGAGGERTWSADLVNQGFFDVESPSIFLRNGGTYSNYGTFRILPTGLLTITGANQSLVQASGTLDNQGALQLTEVTFDFQGGALAGNAPVLAGGRLKLAPGSAGSGSFILRRSVTLDGNIHPDQSLRIEGVTGQDGILTSPAAVTNHSLLVLTSTANRPARFNLTEGAFTNTTSGTVRLAAGSGGARTWSAPLENEGDFFVETNAIFSKSNASYTNRQLLRIEQGAALGINSQNQRLIQEAGTLDVQGALNLFDVPFDFQGGSLTGNAPIVEGGSLRLGPGSAGSGSFILRRSVAFEGNIHPGQQIEIQGIPGHVGVATSSSSVTNQDSLILSSTTNQASRFAIDDGTFVNLQGATVRLAAGAGGHRFWSAGLGNDGSFLVETNATFDKDDAHTTNRGLFQVAAGASLTISGASPQFTQTSGTLDVQGALNLHNGAFHFNGGTFEGNRPILEGGALSLAPASAGSGSFLLRREMTFEGNVHQGQSIEIQATAGHDARITAPGPLTNHHFLILSSNANRPSLLEVENGDFTNAATATLETRAGGGGLRTIRANLDNHGEFFVHQHTAIDRAEAEVVNHGLVVIADGQSLTIAGTYRQETGTTRLHRATLEASGAIALDGGRLAGTGAIAASLDNAATLSLGPGPHGLTVSGNYLQTSVGTLEIEFASPTPVEKQDPLAVAGNATLAGTLEVTLLDGYEPEIGDTFTLLTAASVHGAFDAWSGGGHRPGRGWKVDTTPTAVILRVGPGPISFHDWLNEFYTAAERADPAIGGPNGDPGNTGIDNLTRYFLGMTPWAPDPALLPRPVVVSLENGGPSTRHLAFEFERRRQPMGVTATYQFSKDMQTWTEAGLSEEILFAGNTMETVRIRVEEPIAEDGDDTGFLRLVLADTRP